ncbi:MAG: hypothetical protein ACC656_15145, partial [Candidatus Heimdallarchaeota archaeon]
MELKDYIDYRSKHKLLVEPMNEKELRDNVRKDGTVQAKVLVSFNNVLANDLDYLNDDVSEKITGSTCGLTDICFDLAGRTTNNELILKVTGV